MLKKSRNCVDKESSPDRTKLRELEQKMRIAAIFLHSPGLSNEAETIEAWNYAEDGPLTKTKENEQ